MMDWLLKHPVVIFLIIMGASSLIKHLTASGKAPTAPSGSEPPGGADFDEAERVRRLQAEIRRKIEERRGRPVMPPPVPEQEPVFSAPSWVEPEEEPSPYKMPEPQPLVQTVTLDPVLERQRELAEQLAALNARRADIERVSQSVAPLPETGAAGRQTADVGWLRELRNARSLRKAIVLREVIGPPVALR